ncbi:hypothetical protein L873DRAFT_1785178 [Choiromyces venosus 120613-1]|uniref:Uncharacterized protein n=1 Tax=Choiromyces venosus 120613-1 TaxID=1336337 RepID=A0A3N4K685_9PEZI|nr:hypothetical protein L873DRAFT_1785178 [Choiromyces venosus 120613-1]
MAPPIIKGTTTRAGSPIIKPRVGAGIVKSSPERNSKRQFTHKTKVQAEPENMEDMEENKNTTTTPAKTPTRTQIPAPPAHSPSSGNRSIKPTIIPAPTMSESSTATDNQVPKTPLKRAHRPILSTGERIINPMQRFEHSESPMSPPFIKNTTTSSVQALFKSFERNSKGQFTPRTKIGAEEEVNTTITPPPPATPSEGEIPSLPASLEDLDIAMSSMFLSDVSEEELTPHPHPQTPSQNNTVPKATAPPAQKCAHQRPG